MPQNVFTLRRHFAVEVMEARLLLTTYVVTNVNDSGAGSLRDAIISANAHLGGDVIDFNIPGAGVHTIQPASSLPNITDPVLIDGYSQPGATRNTSAAGDNAVLEVEINGSQAPTFPGLELTSTSSGSELRGLVLNHAGGIGIESGSHNDTIDGNFLGTDPTGMTASGNMITPVLVLANTNTLIGGTTAGARNIIANGSRIGVFLNGGNSNTVRNNFIGVAADGHTAQGNGVGLELLSENHDTIGGNAVGNVISGSHPFVAGQSPAEATGVLLTNSPQNVIQGNLIGTDATGATAVPNQGAGMVADAASRACNIVGNTLSGNGGDGLDFVPVPAAVPGSTVETVSNNFIGTDRTGAHSIGNGGSGVVLVGTGNVVTGNVVSSNASHGIDVRSEGQDVIRGNFIGTDASGKTNLGNRGDGILIESAAGNTIGGTAAGMPNTIAFNGGNGVTVGTSAGSIVAVNNRISANSIFNNAHLGIDLGNDGVTPNTPGGPHIGPNTFQNFPVIRFVRSDPTGTHVSGTLNSTPGRVFSLEFFANPAPDPSGHGQGAIYLGSVQVGTDNSGNAHFDDAALPVAAATGSVITATATDTPGNTSEFSAGASAHLSGDVNGDNTVNFTDLLTLAQHYARPGTLPDGDLNSDSQVNFTDLLILAQNYGRSASAAPQTPVTSTYDDLLLSLARKRVRAAG